MKNNHHTLTREDIKELISLLDLEAYNAETMQDRFDELMMLKFKLICLKYELWEFPSYSP